MNLLSLAGPFRYCGDRKEGIRHRGFDFWLGRRGHEVCLLSCTQTVQGLPVEGDFSPSSLH